MRYASQQDMIDRFGEEELITRTDRADRSEPPPGKIDTRVLNKALSDAADLIDGYLAGRYALPLTVTPPLLTQIACDLARYDLYDADMQVHVSDRWKVAIRTLEKIADGKIVLQVAGAEPRQETSGILTAGPKRVFTSAKLADI